MNRLINHALIAALVLSAGGVGFWFGHDTRHSAEPAVEKKEEESSVLEATVKTTPLATGTIAQTIEAYGTVQPAAGASVSISVPYDSTVTRVLVSPGAKIDARTPVLEIGPTAEAQLQFRQAQDALSAADRNLEQARQRLSEQLTTNADVAIAEQAQHAAATQLDSLRQRGVQDTRTLPAPTAGVVAQVNVQAGQVSPAGTSLLVMNAAAAREAVVGIEPAVATDLKIGDQVALRDLNAGDSAPTLGLIRLIGAQINPQSRLRDVSIALPQNSTLLPGSFVVAHLTIATASGWIVPAAAVLPDDNDQVLFTMADGKAHRRVVTVALRSRDSVQVTSSELHQGDAIIVDGNAELEDGMAVQLAPPSTEPTTEPGAAALGAPAPASAPTSAPAAEDK